MKAIVVKDCLTAKNLLKNYLSVILVFLGISILDKNPYFITGLTVMIPSTMTINAVAYDEHSHTDRLMIASGVARKELVLGKCLFALILIALGSVLNFVVITVADGLLNGLIITGLMAILSFTYTMVLLLLLFKFGVDKSRVYMIICFLIPAGLVYAMTQVIQITQMSLPIEVWVALGVVACLLVILIVVRCSIAIVEKKDF